VGAKRNVRLVNSAASAPEKAESRLNDKADMRESGSANQRKSESTDRRIGGSVVETNG
jgi:hypothetical protein